jgi:hypothetical protein
MTEKVRMVKIERTQMHKSDDFTRLTASASARSEPAIPAWHFTFEEAASNDNN